MNERILIAEDEEFIRESFSYILKKEGFDCSTVSNGKAAVEELEKNNFDIVITDIIMPELDGMGVLEKSIQISPETIVIVMTAYATVESAVKSLREGASDYILKPIDFDEVIIRIKQLLKHKHLALENRYLRNQMEKRYNFDNLVGKSQSMQRVYKMVERVSNATTNVLITGQTGTGKEVIARAIHKNSSRKDNPFIPVNCGAIPENLYESEFFGYKKGAFTGANSDREGLFKAANTGTLFLDEVGDLPEHVQVKLLRVLQEKEILPIGSNNTINVDVRILAATNKDLYEEVQKGNFREDLYYRLNVIEIKLPPLSDRKEDIPLLVNHFISTYNDELKRNIKGVDNDVMKILLNYEWKGNLRELENMIERAVLLCEDDFITVNELPSYIVQKNKELLNVPENLNEAMNEYEKAHILNILTKTEWNRTEAAKLMGVDTSTLYRKMIKYSIGETGPN